MGASGGPDLIQDGLVVSLDAADKTSYPGSGTTWYDLSGNGLNGTLSVDTIGTVSSSLKTMAFDGKPSGNNNVINIAGVPARIEDEAVTMELWVQINEAGWTGMVSQGSYTTGYTTYPNGNGWHVYIDADTSAELATSGNYATGSNGKTDWMLYCGTFEGGTLSAYSNGSLDGSSTSITARVPATTTVQLGADTSLAYYLKGHISTFRLYNRALSSKEVSQNFNAQRSRFGV
jgi:hypothetical protein